MQNLNPLTRTVLAALTPRSERIHEARRRGLKLISDLDARSDLFSVRDVRPYGSVFRGTALALFRDIDFLVPLQAAALATRQGSERSASHTLGQLAAWLEHCRAGVVQMGTVNVRKQTHSVGVEYAGYRVDIVPALVTRGRGNGIFRIPSREDGQWIKTRLDLIEEHVARAPPRVIDAIRLIKGWKRARGRGFKLPSYAVELMLTTAPIPPHNATPLHIASAFLDRIASASARSRLCLGGKPADDPLTYRDPWNGKNLLSGNTRGHYQHLVKRARWTLRRLDDARAAPTPAGALTILRQVFIGSWT